MKKNKEPIVQELSDEYEHNSKAFYLLSEYVNYVKNFKITHQQEYEKIDAKFKENNRLVDIALEGFDLVNFTTKDGDLTLYFVKDGKEIMFDISELYEKVDNDFLVKRFSEYLEEEKKSFETLKRREIELKAKLAELKPDKPRKILGIFTDLVDKDRLQRLYLKKKRNLENELRDILDDKEMTQYQIESKTDIIERIKSTEKFIKSLSQEQKSSIKQKYVEVKEIYEIDKLYQMKLKALDSKMMTLSKFVERSTNEDPKKVLFNLISFMYYSYRKLPDNEKHLYFGNLSSYYKFGKHKTELDILGKAMENQEFGKINRFTLRQLKEEMEKERLMKEQGKQEEQEDLEEENEME